MATTTKPKVEKKESKVKVSVVCLARKFKSEGKKLEDALNKIKIAGGARAMSIITVESKKGKKEKLLNAQHTNRIFGQSSPTTRAYSMKWVKELFDLKD